MTVQPRYKAFFERYEVRPFAAVSEQTLGHEILALTPDPGKAPDLEKAELFAFQFIENYKDEESIFFRPHRSQPLPDGTERVYPDIREVTVAMMDYWQIRAENTNHPVIKARYAGLVYEFGMRVRGQKIHHSITRMFVKALLDTVNSDLIKIFLYKTGKLQKALTVALQLKDSTLIKEVISGTIQLETAVPFTETKNYWTFSFDLLLSRKKKIVNVQEERDLIDRLEQRFMHFTALDTEAAWEAASRLCGYYHSKKDTSNILRIVNLLETTCRRAFDGQPVFQKVHTLERLYNLYTRYGQRAKAIQLLVEIRTTSKDAEKEFKMVSGSTTVAQSEIDHLVNTLLNFQGDQLFVNLAVLNALNMETIKSAAEKSANDNGFYHGMSKSLLDAKGRQIGVIPPYREDALPYITRQAQFSIKYNALLLRMIMNEGIKRGIITVQELMNYIKLSPVFEKQNLSVVERAINYYISSDWVGFTCVIIPQMEESVRNLLEKSEGNILIKKDEVYMLKTLDHILGDPIVVTKLGDATCFHFRVLLTDKTGMNLRNDVAHGYILPDEFSQQNADALLAALLVLVLQTVVTANEAS